MGIRLGIGSLKIGQGSTGIDWSSYWTTRTPSALILTVLSDISIKLDWTANGVEDYDGYSVERSDDGITYAEIDTVLVGTETFTDTGLTSETLYYYRVRAYKGTNYSGYSNVDSDITLVTPVLDLYTTAEAGWGFRLLDSDYAGNCIKVRRSSDDAELDIGFLNGYLDETALLTFAGAGDAFVVTWYDQSGNGNHATQATPANQPQIIDDGDFIVLDGLRVINFNGTSHSLEADALAASFTGTNKPISIYSAAYMSTEKEANLIGFGNSATTAPYIQFEPTYATINKGVIIKRNDSSTPKTVFLDIPISHSYLYSATLGASTASNLNGDDCITPTGQDLDLNIGAITLNTCNIGCLRRTSRISFWNGGVNELIVFAADTVASTAGIEENINAASNSLFFI